MAWISAAVLGIEDPSLHFPPDSENALLGRGLLNSLKTSACPLLWDYAGTSSSASDCLSI